MELARDENNRILLGIQVCRQTKERTVIHMTNNSQSNRLPIFGRDIVDDWSWDREEEEMREANESDSDNEENQN